MHDKGWPPKSLLQESPSSIIYSHGPLSNPTPAPRPCPRERVFMPLSGHSLVADRLSQEGGEQPLIQRYRISPLLSHNPCLRPDRVAGHEAPRIDADAGWRDDGAARPARAAEGDASDRLS